MLILSLAITSPPQPAENKNNISDDEESDYDNSKRKSPKAIRTATKKADDSDSDFDL